MVDPVNEDGAGLVAHPLGENSGKAILFKEGGDALEQEIFGLVAERPVELIFGLIRRADSGSRQYSVVLPIFANLSCEWRRAFLKNHDHLRSC